MKNLIFSLLIIFLAACEKEQVLCQNSPPVLRFSVRNTDTAVPFSADKIRITYLNKDNSKTEISDVKYMKGVFGTYDIVMKAHELGNNTVFFVEADGIKISELSLKTYQDKSPCDGWIHASEVTADGKALSVDKTNYTYVIEVNAQ